MAMTPEQLKLAQEMMKIASGSLTLKDFETKLGVLIDFVSKLKGANQELVANLERKYQETVSQLSDNKDELEQAKKEAMKYCMAEMSKMHKGMEEKMMEMEDKMEEGMQDPAQIALEASKLTLEAVQDQLPTQEQLEQNLPSLGASIRDGLELLPEGEKLKIEAIENLREELDKLKREIMGRVSFGGTGGGGVGKTNVYYYDISSQFTGSLKTFSLPAFSRIIDVKLSSAPVLRPTIDYSVDPSVSTITFTSEISADPMLNAGQSGLVLYAI